LVGAAARLSATAMDAAPQAANDPRTGVRYNAACSAALAGCGQGADAPEGEAERARLRAQALAWLRADLNARIQQAASWFPAVREEAVQALRHWREDPDLAGVRDKSGLDNLPQAERGMWRQLWDEVDAPLQKTAGPNPPLKVEGALEGEELKIVGKSGKFSLGPQDMKPFKDGRWSGDAQLFAGPRKAGEWAELELPVAAGGKYTVVVHLTKARDFGIIQFSLDGKPLGQPFDGFEPDAVVASGPVELGTAELKKGTAVLRVEVTGTNDKSVDLRYAWGLDCVVLKPAN
jgi:hypothetical protein